MVLIRQLHCFSITYEGNLNIRATTLKGFIYMSKITIVGTGRVGLITGACLVEIGHDVKCFDLDPQKIEELKKGILPFYEADLGHFLNRNIKKGKLLFLSAMKEALAGADVIYIAVGTPQNKDGSTDLQAILKVAKNIGENIESDGVIVVIKSTVPVGTNRAIKQLLQSSLKRSIKVDIVSNPEFLREGSAIYDTFHGDRIIIGSDHERPASIIEEINKPFEIPIFKTDIESAEMIKYAANTFLATRISFINELANICEKVGADIENVAYGIGLDHRIGSQYMKPGIGYGGSCLPKDTHSLLQTSKEVGLQGELLKAVIQVNKNQNTGLIKKAKQRFGGLHGKKVALLGLAFKPNTDDVRHSVALEMAKELIKEGAIIRGYDPKATENTKILMGNLLFYTTSIEAALLDADMAFIATAWDEIRDFPLRQYEKLMNSPIIFDGWNCYSLNDVQNYEIEYHSIGRKTLRDQK
jgi:UDPglucose 6-dehydrogenase